MTLSEGLSGNESWELGDKLLLKASEINAYAQSREGEYVERKTSLALGKLATEYRGTPIFVSAGNLLIPEETGIGLGPGQMNGEITGFTYNDYATIDDNFEPVYATGVVMAFEMDKLNGVEPKDVTWNNRVFPQLDSNRFVLGMPIISGNKVMQLDQLLSIPDSMEALLSGNERQIPPYDYLAYVHKIETLMQGKYAFEKFEEGLALALEQELNAMVFNCPYIGNLVNVQANYMRVPKDDGSGNFKIVSGRIVGVLRKFIYGLMVYRGNLRGAVHAVIYDMDVAEAVNNGHITPSEADTHSSTVFVPLFLEHTLTDLGNIK